MTLPAPRRQVAPLPVDSFERRSLQELPTKSEMGSYAPPYWGSMVSVASIGELSWSLGVLRAVCDR